jgi:phospholipid/cholesterol/gamma-HCH transport system substrate-binding protein
VKRAIRTHSRDFIAIIVLFVLACGVTAYIFYNEPAFTFGQSYYTVKARFSSAAAVTSGQGQTIDIAGVQVGNVGGVELQGGTAIVTMNLYKQYMPVYNNATVLLRPRTPLKDMYLALDPGTKDHGVVPNGGILPVGATNPDVDFSQILQALDTDTRDYLLLLLSGGAQAFGRNGGPLSVPRALEVADLSGIFKRFVPLDRETKTFTQLLAQRQNDVRQSIHGLQKVANAFGRVQGSLTSLINSSNTNFAAISSQASALEEGLSLFPDTLHQTTITFQKLRNFGLASTASANANLPFARALGPALQAAQPLFRDTTPVIQNQLRPFAVAVQPLAKILAPGAERLAKATPHLTKAFSVLNALFNELAYQPPGSEQGYLFWGSWLGHIVNTATSLTDAHGAALNGIFMADCPELQLFEVTLTRSTPSLAALLNLLNAPDYSTLPGVKNGVCPGG